MLILLVHFEEVSQDICNTSCKNVFKTSWRRSEDVTKMPLRHLEDVLPPPLQVVFKRASRSIAKMFSRHLQDVFKMYHQVRLFWLTRLQDIFETYLKRFWDLLRKRLSEEWFSRSRFREIYCQGTKFRRVNSLDTPKLFKTVFLKDFMKWLLLQTNTLLIKLGIRKGFAVSVNQESMNKSSSKATFTCTYFFT